MIKEVQARFPRVKMLVVAAYDDSFSALRDQIVTKAQEWPATRLYRWIGFVQAAILANRMLNLEEIIAVFEEAKK